MEKERTPAAVNDPKTPGKSGGLTATNAGGEFKSARMSFNGSGLRFGETLEKPEISSALKDLK